MNNVIIALGLMTLIFACLTLWVIIDMPMPESKQGGIVVEFVDRNGDYDGYGVMR